MRVLLISHTCQSPTEGQPKVIELAKQADVTLEVVVPKQWKHYGCWRPFEVLPEAEPWINPQRVRWPWVGPAQFYLHWYPELAGVIRRFKPDVIDLWEEPWALVSMQTVRLARRLAPNAVVISETEQNLNKQLPLPFEWFRSRVLDRADWLIGRSPEAIQVAESKGYKGPSTYLPNAVDVDLFHPMNIASCRDQLGFSGTVLGYVGRLVEEKGLDELIDALVDLDDSVNVVLIGEGEYESSLQARVQETGVEGRVRFVGSKSLDELPIWMNAIDALVLPSRTTASWKEQFGRVIIEAYACGTPVIGSSSGAIPSVVGELGWVFKECDSSALAAAVRKLKQVDVSVCQNARVERRALAVDRYSWVRVAERYVEVYEQALAARMSDDR